MTFLRPPSTSTRSAHPRFDLADGDDRLTPQGARVRAQGHTDPDRGDVTVKGTAFLRTRVLERWGCGLQETNNQQYHWSGCHTHYRKKLGDY